MKKLKNLKHIFAISLLAFASIFGMMRLFGASFDMSLNGFFIYRTGMGVWQDYFHQHTLVPSGNIVIIRIDEKTLNTLGAQSDQKMLTLPKSTYKTLVEKLEGAGAKGIGFDIVFQNPDPEEGAFANTLQQYPNIVLASSKYTASSGECLIDSIGSGTTCPGVPRSVYSSIDWGIIDIDNAYSRSVFFDSKDTPYQTWKKDIGKSTLIPTLPLSLALTQTGRSITTDSLAQYDRSSILQPFFGPPGSYASYSLIDVINMSRVNLMANFRGKYIFIGESGTLIHDSLISPVTDTMMDGVETHAHFLDGLLQNKMLTTYPYQSLWILLMTLLSILAYYSLPKYISPIIAILIVGASLSYSRYLYDHDRMLVMIFPILLSGGIITLPLTFIYRFFVVDREKRFIKNAFGHYIDPHVVNMIDDAEVEMSLGGERREVTLLFSDIAGFTSISEKLGTQELFYLMSAYLSRETDILIREGGTLDKYIGDAIMGFFGAPVSQVDHAIRACHTAIAMRKGLPQFNAEITKRGIDPIDFRVGIATGEAMIGNIGSKEHFNYTALGDTVNLASRLEGTGKEYHVHCIISEGTYRQIGDIFITRELDTIAVKGKTEGIRIYELIDLKSDTDHADQSLHTTYEQALALYRSGKYLDAGKLWESQMEKDPPSEVMARRCVDILEKRIIVENGIYHMTHK